MIFRKDNIDMDMISGICDWVCIPTTYNLAVSIADINNKLTT